MNKILILLVLLFATCRLHAQISGLPATLPPTWSSGPTYPIGTYVIYQNAIYQASEISSNQPPSATSAYWTLMVGGSSSSSNQTVLYSPLLLMQGKIILISNLIVLD